jgi:hypothetical protein
MVDLRVIRKYGWDSRNNMGSILKTKFRFTTLQGIRNAYEAAFYKEADAIDAMVQSGLLGQLSALRNVIVHKSGIADSEYIQSAKEIKGLPELKSGDKLYIDGPMIAGLVPQAANLTNGLIYVVDEWLHANAVKSE